MTPEEVERQGSTLELINAELAARLDRQADSSAKIDTKAIALAGYVVAAATFLATQHPQPVLAGLAYADYMVALGFCISAYAAGSYRDVPNPRRLFNGYVGRPKSGVLAALAAERVRAFEANASRHERKVRLWRVSVASLAVGVTLMVISLLAHTSHHDSTTRSRPSTSPLSARAVSTHR